MIACATNEGICLLEFSEEGLIQYKTEKLKKYFNAEFSGKGSRFFPVLKKELNEYFEKKRKSFSVPLVITGTEFQKKAWKSLLKIPYGETRSYLEQATLSGNPKSVRAIGGANGRNKIVILIPCHRVIGANGKLVGFGAGLWRKEYLLDLESKDSNQKQ